MAEEELQRLIDRSNSIVFFGGAGVSTESGIPDFRSEDGLYRQQYRYPPEEIISHSFFISHPEEFYEFYKKKMICRAARPNAAHLKLAELERAKKLSAVITQNIDGLHQMAGSKNVLELHGSVHRNYCTKCGKSYSLDDVADSEGVPRCSCGGMIKPDVVLYEECLDGDVMTRAEQALCHADLLIVAGTSLAVYPAAGMINYYRGGDSVLINKSATPYDSRATLLIHENVGETLGRIQVL